MTAEARDKVVSMRRIRDCALEEIRRTGILGLRLAEVAAAAEVSVPLIHKHFGDRDGLIADVLGEEIERQFRDDIAAIEALLRNPTKFAEPSRLLALVPMPGQAERRERRWLRLEAKAAGREIPALRRRLRDAIAAVESSLTDLVVRVRGESGNTSSVPAVTIAWALVAFSDGFTNGDLSENQLTDEDYLPLISSLLHTHVF